MRAVVAGLLIANGTALAQNQPDRCLSLIPASLAAQLEEQFPQHELPRASAYDPQDVSYSVEHGGSGCLAVATGEFDGTGVGFAVLLGRKDGGEPTLLVAAQAAGPAKWSVQQIYKFQAPLSWLYVARLEPGEYSRAESAEGRLEAGERVSVKSTRIGLLAGKIESWACGFFLLEGDWVHVRMAD